MTDCKPAKTPMEVGLKPKGEGDCHYEYRSPIGYLMYLAVCSRPVIVIIIMFNDYYL